MRATDEHESVRVSRLAVASLVVAVAASPCVMSQVMPGRGATPYLFAPAAVSIAVPIVALVRIGRSRGTRTGMAWAVVALVLSVIGWGLIFLMLGAVGSHWHG
jgi:hypothetical protein